MTMSLHILLKDLRRHRWEIAFYVATVAGWGWQLTHPFGWVQLHLHDIIPIFMFVAWFFVTARVIQGESLVGDREFWPTRPYRWWQLLIAKALFLAICLNLPLFIMQCCALWSAEIPLSASLLPELLFLQLEFALFLTLPAVALASITESVVQWVLSILGMGLFVMLVSLIPWNRLPPPLAGGEGVGTWLGIALLAPALAGVIVWQYRMRQAFPARVAFACIVCIVPLVVALASTSSIKAIAYPSFSGERDLQFSFVQSDLDYTRYVPASSSASITFSAQILGNSPDHLVSIEGTRFTLLGGNGWRWQSPWNNTSIIITPDSGEVHFTIDMPSDIGEQLRQQKPEVQIELATANYRLHPPFRVNTTSDRSNVEGVGVCSWTEVPALIYNSTSYHCTAPLHMPDVLITRFDSGDSKCHPDEGEDSVPPGHYATNFQWGSGFPEFDPDPRRQFFLGSGLGGWIPPVMSRKNPKEPASASFCRGTPLTLRIGSLERRTRTTVSLGHLVNERVINRQESTVIFQPSAE